MQDNLTGCGRSTSRHRQLLAGDRQVESLKADGLTFADYDMNVLS